MADAKVMGLDEKARQAKAAAERAKAAAERAKAAAERAKPLAEQAMQKAHIMQMLIRGDIYEASEMYEAVMRASERASEKARPFSPQCHSGRTSCVSICKTSSASASWRSSPV